MDMLTLPRKLGRVATRRLPIARLLAVVGLLAMLSSCGISATSGWSGTVPGKEDQKNTNLEAPFGPLYPSDVAVLVAVSQAGYWEAPASELVAKESTNPKVKAVAAQLSSEHHALNMYNEIAASRLHVQLPTAATPQQNSWREEIAAASGAERDRLYVQLTRAAHGSVYMKVVTVRATTQNDVVRSLAQVASEYVARHMALLESTGLADLNSLAVHSGTDAEYQPTPSVAEIVLGVGLALVAGFGTLVLVRLASRQTADTAEDEVAIE
jgi:putative membrane protein